MDALIYELRKEAANDTWSGLGELLTAAANTIERQREALLSVRSEIDLSKAPNLMAKIEAALANAN